MTFQHFVQNCEMKFWNTVTPVLGKQPADRKFQLISNDLVQHRSKYIALLVVIWGFVGFVAGLVIGRIIGLL